MNEDEEEPSRAAGREEGNELLLELRFNEHILY